MSDRPNEIDAVAANWAATAHGGWRCEADRRACEAWLDADARHLGAFARACAVLEVARAARDGSVPSHEALPAFYDIEATRRLTRRRMIGGLAATFAAVATLPGPIPAAKAMEYRTRRGEQRTVELDDGAVLTLNTQTRLALEQGRGGRKLRLDYGEIALSAPAGSVPLTMMILGAEIALRDAELAASILSAGHAELMVTGGSVELRADGQRGTLGAGDLIRLEAGRVAGSARLSPVEQRAMLAWRTGMIDFRDVSLADAARSFARYNAVDIRFGGADVARLRITGVFSLGRPRQFAEAVGKALDLRVRHDDGSVTLEKM